MISSAADYRFVPQSVLARKRIDGDILPLRSGVEKRRWRFEDAAFLTEMLAERVWDTLDIGYPSGSTLASPSLSWTNAGELPVLWDGRAWADGLDSVTFDFGGDLSYAFAHLNNPLGCPSRRAFQGIYYAAENMIGGRITPRTGGNAFYGLFLNPTASLPSGTYSEAGSAWPTYDVAWMRQIADNYGLNVSCSFNVLGDSPFNYTRTLEAFSLLNSTGRFAHFAESNASLSSAIYLSRFSERRTENYTKNFTDGTETHDYGWSGSSFVGSWNAHEVGNRIWYCNRTKNPTSSGDVVYRCREDCHDNSGIGGDWSIFVRQPDWWDGTGTPPRSVRMAILFCTYSYETERYNGSSWSTVDSGSTLYTIPLAATLAATSYSSNPRDTRFTIGGGSSLRDTIRALIGRTDPISDASSFSNNTSIDESLSLDRIMLITDATYLSSYP